MPDIAGLPFWQLTFDAEGDMDAARAKAVIDDIKQQDITELVVFSHGWNNSQATARGLYDGWFSTLAGQLDEARADPPVRVGLVGVFWPSQRWSDEPIPDFKAPAKPRAGGAGGGAGVSRRPTTVAGSAAIDKETLAGLRKTFPDGAAHLDRMAKLLAGEPSAAAVAELKTELDAFSNATAVDDDDDGEGEAGAAGTPRMLDDEPAKLFDRYASELHKSGVVDVDGGGEAGVRDKFAGLLHGAKEALRQATYWQMKNRAGKVGRAGLGPFLGRLAAQQPDLRVHLVGHSFGARLVSYTLAGLPAGKTSPVRSLTLLQGAFSHFAFADSLPHDPKRKGPLAGMLSRIEGPLTVCFSSHDDAVGRFYPLASITARDDSAAAKDRFFRWGGMGHDGAQAVHAKLDSLQEAGSGAVYRFEDHKALNIDCSEVVSTGAPPSGAHSDIVHTELTWVVLKAGGIVP